MTATYYPAASEFRGHIVVSTDESARVSPPDANGFTLVTVGTVQLSLRLATVHELWAQLDGLLAEPSDTCGACHRPTNGHQMHRQEPVIGACLAILPWPAPQVESED